MNAKLRFLLCVVAALMPLMFIWIDHTFIPAEGYEGYEIANGFSCLCVMVAIVAFAFHDKDLRL